MLGGGLCVCWLSTSRRLGALEVEGEEVFEDLFVGEGVGPAVGVEDGVVEGGVDVVQFLDVGAGDGFAGHFVELGDLVP